ncbi:postacrosomal sheath WW domain-binding protein [Myotis daubentonii]|uniref:postacrosomal sheath WW domain-binding protein n=1 Tax=Myotis daubentonii TaxID=98922 RepID=UPI002872CF37|nr:postacrosomal sheath WW domain-binding protein [Myotis daubentonii]
MYSIFVFKAIVCDVFRRLSTIALGAGRAARPLGLVQAPPLPICGAAGGPPPSKMAVNQSHTENRRKAYIPYCERGFRAFSDASRLAPPPTFVRVRVLTSSRLLREVAVAQAEAVLNQCSDVELSFPEQPPGSNFFHGTKRGTLLLTSYRVIFVTLHSVSDPMLSFMMPFDLMSNCTLEQPVFAPIYIQGTIQAAPDGGWEGQATFKLSFRKGGAIKFSELMMKAASAAAKGTPLQSITYWFGAPGQFIVSGQGNMMCNQQTSCPVVVYGPQPVRYGPPPAGYGPPPPGYEAPPAGYGPPPPGYEAPPAGYGPPPPGYGPPPPGYEAPPAGYGPPPPGYGPPPPGYEAPPQGYEAPPAGNRVDSHNPEASQPDGYDASLPSTSSPQHHSPPSKN